MSDATTHTHQVLRTWVRRTKGATPEEVDGLTLIAGEGVQHDHTRGKWRHVTLLCVEDWEAATAAIGHEVDPVHRRANVLLSGGRAGDLLGTTIRLGEATIEIRGETKPCDVMEQAAAGLEEALMPEFRAGVWGVILEGGRVQPGDALVVA